MAGERLEQIKGLIIQTHLSTLDAFLRVINSKNT